MKRSRISTQARALIAIVLAVSTLLILVHWHRDARTQDCGMCDVQHMAGLLETSLDLAALPDVVVRTPEPADASVPRAVIPGLRPGRAPPSSHFPSL